MKNKKMLYSILVLIKLVLVSCTDEEVALSPSLIVNKPSLDFGELVAGGGSFSITDTIVGVDIPGNLHVSVEGAGYSVNREVFRLASSDNYVIVTFTPATDAVLGTAIGLVTLTGGDLTESIDLSATIVEPTFDPYDPGTIVYSSGFEFGKNGDWHGDDLVLADIEGLTTNIIYAGVSVSYSISATNVADLEFNTKSALCNGTEVDGFANADSDTGCGNALQLKVDAIYTITLSDIPPEAPYDATLWVRPGGSTERSFSYSLGANTLDKTFLDADKTKFEKFEISGSSDADGILTLKIVVEGSSGRSVSFDNFSIVAGN